MHYPEKNKRSTMNWLGKKGSSICSSTLAGLPGITMEKRNEEAEKNIRIPAQITLFTVLRRKKKCIRYLQGEGRCGSPVSSDGSTVDSPSSPLTALQCISSSAYSCKLTTPADSAQSEQNCSLPASIKTISAKVTTGHVTRVSYHPSDSSEESVAGVSPTIMAT